MCVYFAGTHRSVERKLTNNIKLVISEWYNIFEISKQTLSLVLTSAHGESSNTHNMRIIRVNSELYKRPYGKHIKNTSISPHTPTFHTQPHDLPNTQPPHPIFRYLEIIFLNTNWDSVCNLISSCLCVYHTMTRHGTFAPRTHLAGLIHY